MFYLIDSIYLYKIVLKFIGKVAISFFSWLNTKFHRKKNMQGKLNDVYDLSLFVKCTLIKFDTSLH